MKVSASFFSVDRRERRCFAGHCGGRRRFSGALRSGDGDTNIELDDSVGLAVVAGVDIDINEDWFFNGALWYIDIETDADLETAGAGDLEVNVDIDPWVLMLGVGTSF